MLKRARDMGLRRITVESSVGNSDPNTICNRRHRENKSEIGLTQRHSEVLEIELRGGHVQARFSLGNSVPKWLVKSALERRDCRDAIILGEDRLNRNRQVTPRAIPGSVRRVRGRVNKANLSSDVRGLNETLRDECHRPHSRGI